MLNVHVQTAAHGFRKKNDVEHWSSSGARHNAAKHGRQYFGMLPIERRRDRTNLRSLGTSVDVINAKRSLACKSPQSRSSPASPVFGQSPLEEQPGHHLPMSARFAIDLADVGWSQVPARAADFETMCSRPNNSTLYTSRKPRLLERSAGFLAASSPKEESSTPRKLEKPWVPSRPKDANTPYKQRKHQFFTRSDIKSPSPTSSLKVRSSYCSGRGSSPDSRGPRFEGLGSLDRKGSSAAREMLSPFKKVATTKDIGDDVIFSGDSPEPDAMLQPGHMFTQENTEANLLALTGDMLPHAREAFSRYHDSMSGNPFDEKALLDALADFGIMSQTHSERRAVRSAIRYFDQGCMVSFEEFCAVIESARTLMREAAASSFNHSFRTVDYLAHGFLERKNVFALLKELGVMGSSPSQKKVDPQCDSDIVAIVDANMVAEVIPARSCEAVAQFAQECIVRRRRTKERQITEEMELEDDLLFEFKGMLADIHEDFCLCDSDQDGALEPDEVVMLLTDLGYIKNGRDATNAQDGLEARLDEIGEDSMGFKHVLEMMRDARHMQRELKFPEIIEIFGRYDRDDSGALDIAEICKIIEDLGLAPQTVTEQQNIAILIHNADVDSSGDLGSHELSILMQRIQECLHFERRSVENNHAMALGFTMIQTYEFRNVFLDIDKDGSGLLSFNEVVAAIHCIGWPLPTTFLKSAFVSVDEKNTGELNFSQFMSLMQKCETELTETQKKIEEERQLKLTIKGLHEGRRTVATEDTVNSLNSLKRKAVLRGLF